MTQLKNLSEDLIKELEKLSIRLLREDRRTHNLTQTFIRLESADYVLLKDILQEASYRRIQRGPSSVVASK